MNRLTAILLIGAILTSTVVPTRAATGTTNDSTPQLPVNPPALTAPTVLSQKVALNSAELAKYQQKTEQSQALAKYEAAGGTGKTVTVVVVTVLVIAGVAALALVHDGTGSWTGPLFPSNVVL